MYHGKDTFDNVFNTADQIMFDKDTLRKVRATSSGSTSGSGLRLLQEVK